MTSSNVKLGIKYLEEPRYMKVKEYVKTKYDYLSSLCKLDLGDREGIETDVQWKVMSDLIEYLDQIDLYEDLKNNKVRTLKLDR